MAAFKLPSGAKVRAAIEDYIESAAKDEYEGISGNEAQRHRHWSIIQERHKALFEMISVHDLRAVAHDKAKLAQWIESHVKHEKTALRRIVEEVDLGAKAREALKTANEDLSDSFSLLDSKTASPVQDEDVERIVSAIRKLMTVMPVIAGKVLEDVVPGVQESIVRQCDQLRDAIQGVREYVKAEAIKDCQERVLAPHNLNMLEELILRRGAPQAALRESEEIENLKIELKTANEEIARYLSELADLERGNIEDRAALEEERESRQTAESEVASQKSDEQQAQRDLATARQELQELKSQLLEKKGVETALAESEKMFQAESKARLSLETRLADSESRNSIEREAAAKELESAKASLLEQFKEQLAKADLDAKAGLARFDDEAKGRIAKAREAEDHAEEKARLEVRKREKAEQDLSGKTVLLDQAKDRFELQSDDLATARDDLAKQKRQALYAADELETANTALLNEKAARDKAERDLKAERKAHEQTKTRLAKSEKASERHQHVVKARDAAEKALREERSVLAATRESLDNLKLHVAEQTEQHKTELSIEHDAFTEEQSVHEETRQEAKNMELRLIRKAQAAEEASNQLQRTLNANKKQAEADKGGLEGDLDSQRQAVDAFLQYLTASLAEGSASLVVAPGAQELTTLHTNRTELAPEQSEQLPMIVIASGHLPAAFSYLCLASGGVLSSSRFNRAVTSSNLPWVSDTLDRVVEAVVASQELVASAVLIVLLQGIAYVHLASRYSSIQTTPRLKDMLNSLYNLIPRQAQRAVLATVYRLVSRLVYHQSPINSWTFDDSPLDKRIDSSNSALPEGITLIHSAGYLFLQHSAADGEHLFIIDPQAVQFVVAQLGHIYLQLPIIDGFDLRRMDIVTGQAHFSIAGWLRAEGLLV